MDTTAISEFIEKHRTAVIIGAVVIVLFIAFSVASYNRVHAVYRTVNHAAVKERRTICDSCKQDITGSYSQHKAASGHSSYHYEYKVTKEAYSEKVLVSAAYDETVTTGYKCSSCGATK